jgi:hypothetical protein
MLIPLSVMLIYIAACVEALAQEGGAGSVSIAGRVSATGPMGADVSPALDKGLL